MVSILSLSRMTFLAAAFLAASLLPTGAVNAGNRDVVAFAGYPAGTIVVKTGERRLYYVLGGGQAVRYPIAVGMPGREWEGTNTVARKEVNPTWVPPAEVRHDKPTLPAFIPPGPSNPLGPRALVLAWGEYAIHGTNKRESIGTRASYGCIRMYNEDVADLYNRVSVGTQVVMVQ